MKKNLLFILVASFIGFTSCTKTEDASIMKYENSGFISGTIKGLSADSVSLNENFKFTSIIKNDYLNKYSNTVSSVTINVGETLYPAYKFNISRMIDGVGSMNFTFYTFDNSSQVLTGLFYNNIASFNLSYYKELGNGTVLNYNVNQSNLQGNSLSVAIMFPEFNYNEKTGLVSGTYSIGVSKKTTIVGSFSTTVYKIKN